jgi:hypothetical protein
VGSLLELGLRLLLLQSAVEDKIDGQSFKYS